MSAEVELGWNNSQLQAGARGASAIVTRASNDMRGALGSIGQGLGLGVGSSIFNTIKDGVRSTAGEVVDATIKFDSLRLGMTALEGSTERANARLAQMQTLAKSPGLGFEQVVDADIKLRSVGLNAALSARTIEEMGNALAVVGKGKADLDGVLLAITQIVSKGKVSAEELNQIAERVPQIRKVLKDTFGTADSEALQKLNIPVELFIKKTVDGFANTIPRAIVGMQGKVDNVTDAMTARFADFGSSFSEHFVIPLDEAANTFENSAQTFQGAGALVGDTLRGVVTVTGTFLQAGKYVVDGLGQLTEDSLRWAFSIEKDVVAMEKAATAAVRLSDRNKELIRNAQDLKRYQDQATEATANLADAQLKARERALELAKAQKEVAEKTEQARDKARSGFLDQRRTTSDKTTSNEDKLAVAKEKLLGIERDLNKVLGQRGGEELAYKLQQERERVMQDILEVSKAISAQNERDKKELDDQARKAAEIAAERQAELALLEAELAILAAQNAGELKKAEAMKRTRDIAEETLRIMEATGLSQEEAVKKATELVDAQNKARERQRQPGDRFNGYQGNPGDRDGARQRAEERANSGEQRRKGIYDRSFGGLDELERNQNKAFEVNTPGLDAFQRLQDRSRPVGAPLPAANGSPNGTQEMPTVEGLLKQLITVTEGLKEA